MCNLSEGLREEGFVEGIEIGVRKGRAEGREENQICSIRAIMESLKCSVEMAMDLLKIPEESRKMLLEKL